MFKAVRGFKKEDLIFVAVEIGQVVEPNSNVVKIKDLILASEEYRKDPEFVQNLLETVIAERKIRENDEKEYEAKKLEKEHEHEAKKLEHELEAKKLEKELEVKRFEKEKELELEAKRLEINKELELARIHSHSRIPIDETETDENISSKHKFTLPKLEFRKFDGELKEWLPFWSQFEQIHKDNDISLENKFQYLIQATIAGSRARDVVESFPPTGANYVKVIESLKSRFGREDMLVEVYVRELLKLIISVQSKGNVSLTSLYDKLESYLRALETLGVTSEKCASILYPMVESCFPVEFLKAWNRNNTSRENDEAKERLDNLMQFLKTEVEGEERINLAIEGFGLVKKDAETSFRKKKIFRDQDKQTSTAAMLFNSQKQEVKRSCVFCNLNNHPSSDCFAARKMSFKEKQNILREKNCCFLCFSSGHHSNKCKTVLKCFLCGQKHHSVICQTLDKQGKSSDKIEGEKVPEKRLALAIIQKNPRVFLQTLRAKLTSENKVREVRILFDSGSQKSYILKKLAQEMNYKSISQEKVIQTLFGGVTTKEVEHNFYQITLSNKKGGYQYSFDVLDQEVICQNVMPIMQGTWLKELRKKKIILTDVGDSSEPIQILIGADVMGRLLTGRRIELSSGLVAIETKLGWTLMGKVPIEMSRDENLALAVTSLFIREADISNLWRLDLIGIKDPIEKKAKEEIDRQTKEHFLETIKVNKEMRYEICLPWAEDVQTLPDNFDLAKKRLQSTTKKLITKNMYEAYENVFQEWMKDGIIEEVSTEEANEYGHYLPHHPVIKLSSSTTPIRPVFDASAKLANQPSLNQCLRCGPNLLELIPDVLLRFREKKIGVTADIKKAFLQISICKEDRKFLRFLWWNGNHKESKLKVFCHTRVVFGVVCSPFLLSSVIEYHIKRAKGYEEDFKQKLLHSFYVDNVVTSVDNTDQLEKFISEAKDLMKKGSFDLRQWEHTDNRQETSSDNETQVLGLIWNKKADTLKLKLDWIDEFDVEKITKRSMLSAVHKVFDPFGFTTPIMICPKIMLQQAWREGLKWDEGIKGDLKKDFLMWFKELIILKNIEIPRSMELTPNNQSMCSLHTFMDGSKNAYATVIFLRIQLEKKIKVIFVTAKARVAPLKSVTIPRMELLAATMGTRLTQNVVDALGWQNMRKYFWSDSTTVLAWITREDNWSVFVKNRISEIRKLSNPLEWNHVSGENNPADLPSRGCKAKYLASIKWWEGPKWLKNPEEYEKYLKPYKQSFNEEEISKEKVKAISLNVSIKEKVNWYYKYYSDYGRILRLVAWVMRFKHNCQNISQKRYGELNATEIQEAEIKVLYMIQQEMFTSENDDRLKTLKSWKDEQGIIRLTTKITCRSDREEFLKPVILPSKHEVVRKLIFYVHKQNCHAGLQILLNLLREKFWILNGRKAVKQVLAKCVVCQRYNVKSLWRDFAPLPKDRIKDAAIFQITGVDMTGPLYLKDGKKSWILIFTCAIYRAIHLELVTAASTEAFLMGLRRFISRRGRCSTIYCDNGGNFVGSASLLRNLNWNCIQKDGAMNAIVWKFNPPTAAWWGGFWERLIRIVKDLLKRILGRALLTYEELNTVLTDVERVVNSRPLTYLSEDSTIKTISPAMFLQDIQTHNINDIDAVEQKSLNKRLKYRQMLSKELRDRFRSEYLGILIQRSNQKRKENEVKIDDIVLIGSDNRKRIDWPMGRITEIIPGRDKKIRLVRVRTATNELLRPVQRIYPLEIQQSEEYPSVINSNEKS